MLRRYSQFSLYYAPDGDGGGGGGTPAAPAAPAAPASPAPAAAPASPTPTTRTDGGDPTPPARPGAPAAPAPTKYTYDEDRSKWVDPSAVSTLNEQLAQQRWEYERLKKMVEAGTGFKMPERPEPEDPQLALAREGLLKILPPAWRQSLEFLASQLERDPKFLETLGSVPQLRGTFEQGEFRRGLTVVDSIFDGAAKELGITPDKLTQFQKTRLGNGFTEWLQQDPKLVERYAQGDTTTLVTEYLNEWRTGFLGPGQRTRGAGPGDQSDRNRNLPGAPRQSGIPPSGTPPPKPKTEDEVHDNAWKQFRAATGS